MRFILINGWSASFGLIEHFSSKLSKDVDLIVLDHLYQHSISDIHKKLDDLMIEETVLVGWSLGGMLALNYMVANTSDNPPKAIILLNTPLVFLDQGESFSGISQPDFEKLKSYVDDQDASTLIRVFGHLLVQGSASYRQDKRYLSSVYSASGLPSWNALNAGLNYLATLNLIDNLKSLSCPVLVLLGAEDALVSMKSNSALYRTSTNIRVVEVNQMGHYPFGVFAETTYGYVKLFLEENCVSTSSVSQSS